MCLPAVGESRNLEAGCIIGGPGLDVCIGGRGGRGATSCSSSNRFSVSTNTQVQRRSEDGRKCCFLWAVLIQPCRPGGSVPAAKKKELINLVLQVVLKGIGKKMSDNLFPSRIVVNKKRLHKLKVSVQQVEG